MLPADRPSTRLLRRIVPGPARRRIRSFLDRPQSAAPAAAAPWFDDVASPWQELTADSPAVCNICRWTGDGFEGVEHSESAVCPQCGSVARDRFLFHCMQQRMPPSTGATVLETSPRLGDDYRRAMARWFDYTCSDFDERGHKGTVKLDLQRIDLDDSSVDLILTPHVLEHVPDTEAALGEIRRTLRLGGRMYLQVPVLQGQTAPPETPEFHGDDTPVFWRFGFDLTARLRNAGFDTTVLVPEQWRRSVSRGDRDWDAPTSPEFDVADMLAGAVADDLVTVADDATSRRHGYRPAYMFVTWECVAG